MADEIPPKERGRVYSINWLTITVASILSSLLLGYIVHRVGVYQGTRLGFIVYFVLAVIVAILSVGFLFIAVFILMKSLNLFQRAKGGCF